jgi:hypothetical protein
VEHETYDGRLLPITLRKKRTQAGGGDLEFLTTCGKCYTEVLTLLVGSLGRKCQGSDRAQLIERCETVADTWRYSGKKNITHTIPACSDAPHKMANKSFINFTVLNMFEEYREGPFRNVIWPLLLREKTCVKGSHRYDRAPRFSPVKLYAKGELSKKELSFKRAPTPTRTEEEKTNNDYTGISKGENPNAEGDTSKEIDLLSEDFVALGYNEANVKT